MMKKIIYILILIIIFAHSVTAETQYATVEYGGYDYAFKPGDEINFLNYANKNMRLFENTQLPANKNFYLKEAMRYYFLLSKIQPNSIDAQVGLGRVYDEFKLDKFAQEHFFIAFNFDNDNPKTNFYFANYYYKRSDYINALNYYKQAYKYGYSRSYFLNKRLGNLYEKLADIETAEKYYKIALKLNQKDSELIDKIHSLDDLNYTQSQYYLFKK